MNIKTRQIALCLTVALAQNASALDYTATLATMLQTTAVVDSEHVKPVDSLIAIAPFAIQQLAKYNPKSSGIKGLAIGTNVICAIRGLYLHRDFFKEKFSPKRVCKLLATAVGTAGVMWRGNWFVDLKIEQRRIFIEEQRRKKPEPAPAAPAEGAPA